MLKRGRIGQYRDKISYIVRNMESIRTDAKSELAFLSGYDVVIFGSYVTGDFREGSDIDIALITKIKDYERNLNILKSLIGKAPPICDIRVFELLSLDIKASVMDNYTVLYGQLPDISEYFYFYRKLWDDCKHRVSDGRFKSYRDQIAAINRFKQFKNRTENQGVVND